MKEPSSALKEFCEKQELMRLAYTDSRGFPRAVPVWFVVIDGNYYLGTYLASEKWKSIERDPRVGWVIDGGENPSYRGMSMYGRAEEVTGDERTLIYNELAKKYFGTPDDPTLKQIYGEADDAKTGYLRLRPEGNTSWEY
jgi:nitroimidazol reductase NimA-like FMN-containing flavoprotein (pyridoxamine 5'-phosphate oxidase superfamily)